MGESPPTKNMEKTSMQQNEKCYAVLCHSIHKEDQEQPQLQKQQQQPQRQQQHRGRRPAATSRAYPALDGGWGYFVAVGAFCVAFMLDGTESSYGLLLPHVITAFGGHVALASMCGGLVTGVILGAGPLAAYLVRKFGCRPVSIVGSVIASASVVMATLARRIEVFVLFYGLTAGFGMGLVYLPSVTMINSYFNRKRGLFAGIVTSGSGIGLLVISLLIDVLISEYGWRGCYLIIAGVLLNLCVCSSLMRPLADNYRSRTSDSEISISTPVSEETVKHMKITAKSKDAHVSDWVASQPLLPSEQTKGLLKNRHKTSGNPKNAPVPQFISLQKLAQEGQDLGRPQGEETKPTQHVVAPRSQSYDLSQSLQAQLDCDGETLQQVKYSHTTDGLYRDATSTFSDTDKTGSKAQAENANSGIKGSNSCHCNCDQSHQVFTNNDWQDNATTPDIVINDDNTFQTEPSAQSTCCDSSEVDQTVLASYSQNSINPSLLQNGFHKPNLHHINNSSNHTDNHSNHIDNHNNHIDNHSNHMDSHNDHTDNHNNHIDNYNNQIDNHNNHTDNHNNHMDNHNNHSQYQHLHHHNHHTHHDHNQGHCVKGSHSTLHDSAADSESVVSSRPARQKSSLLNILPDFIGSLSNLSVKTVHSAHSGRYRGYQRALRSSLWHERASSNQLNRKGGSRASLGLGFKYTLPGSFSLDVEGPGKELGDLEDQSSEEDQVEDYKSCDLFKILRFDLFCIGAFLVQVAAIIPTMFVPSYVVSAGLSSSTAATIVSILGISNTAGRLSAGFLSYLGLGSVRIYNSGTFLAGLACFVLPLGSSFPSLVAFAVGYGFFIGFFPPLQSVILVEQLGLERLPASFGIMCVCKSVASVSGPFFAGALYEWAQSYAVPFYLSGITMLLANIVHCVMSLCPQPDFMVS